MDPECSPPGAGAKPSSDFKGIVRWKSCRGPPADPDPPARQRINYGFALDVTKA